jgi:glycosyltransferase involved in cell wall biosynthesis
MAKPLPANWHSGFNVKDMRILQVNLKDNQGGAAQIAWNLHRVYRMRGLDAHLAVSRKFSSAEDVFEIPHEPYKSSYIRLLRRLGKNLEAASTEIRGLGRLGGFLIWLTEIPQNIDVARGRENFYAPGTRYLLQALPQPPDILHLHNLHKNWQNDRRDYFDLRELPRLSRVIPVAMTLHDAWLLSGHCAHSMACERWQTGCGQCPDLGIYPALKRDATAYNWQRKREIFRQSRLHVVAPSRWLMEKVEKSILAAGVVSSRVIPNGVDLTIFHPGAKDKSILGLPENAKILLFTADGIRINKMKDFETLRLAIDQLAGRVANVVFVALGEAGKTERVGQAEIRFMPYQKNTARVAQYYRAADVYIHAARADTFPNSVIESLACGTPVIATRVGGIPEQIKEGQTGFLTRAGDAQEMAKKIELLLQDTALAERMGKAAAQDAHTRFDLNLQVDQYLSLYQEIQKGIH